MKDHLRNIIQVSLASSPEEMLETSLDACIDLAGANGGSILAEEGPFLQILFSNLPELIGVHVPFDSLAGTTVSKNKVIFTYAPEDKRHFTSVDEKLQHVTKYLLSIPIPSIHSGGEQDLHVESAGALQLLFEDNILSQKGEESWPLEFTVGDFENNSFYKEHLEDLFCILPIIAFGMEIVKLRQTSYQAIHELKNKMIAAQSWIDYLKEDIIQIDSKIMENENIKEDFELSISSIRSGSELAVKYLQFTKIFSPTFAPTNINDVLNETSASSNVLATDLGATDLKVTTDLCDDIIERELDGNQLNMAFFNLCKNAIEALIEHNIESPTISLSSNIEDDRICIRIKDNGNGMPPEIADNLFIPFKTKKEGGTGLGLTIAKKIIDVHGGTIRCNTDSNGTEFSITI